MGDQEGTAAAALPALSTDDPHGLAVKLELHLSVGQQARPFPDLGWDGDLTFRCNAHDHRALLFAALFVS
jgi:hypothetical protein